ncbi:MAG: SRPBCC family protein [Jatrophihabitans sp.]
MATPTVMSCSRTYPVTLPDAFDAVLTLPLTTIFDQRYGPIPPIKSDDFDGEWGTVGQSRTIQLRGGGSMREELTRVDRPTAFGYRISGITGPMKPLASHIDGLWSFDSAGTGVRVTWQWQLHPASAVSAAIVPVFARFWRGYAAQSLARIESVLLPS